jgi:hypothetical protein
MIIYSFVKSESGKMQMVLLLFNSEDAMADPSIVYPLCLAGIIW